MRNDDAGDAHFVQTLKERFVGRMFGTRPASPPITEVVTVEPSASPPPVASVAVAPPSPASSSQKREFGSVDREQRKRTERAASATRAQRAALARQQAAPRRDKMLNLRTTEERFLEIKAMAASAGISVTALLERGIELVAEELARHGKGSAP